MNVVVVNSQGMVVSAGPRVSADRVSADRVSADRVSADRVSADRVSADSRVSAGNQPSADQSGSRVSTGQAGSRYSFSHRQTQASVRDRQPQASVSHRKTQAQVVVKYTPRPERAKQAQGEERDEYPPYLQSMSIFPQLDLIIRSISEQQVCNLVSSTGTGKTCGVSITSLLELLRGNLNVEDIVLSIPTITAVRSQYNFATDKNRKLAHLIGFSCGGFQSKNFSTAKLKFVTTQIATNMILSRFARKNVSKSLLFIDESHAPSQENYVLQAVANYLVGCGFPMKVLMASATPSDHTFEHLKMKPILIPNPTKFSVETHYSKQDSVMFDPETNDTSFDTNVVIRAILETTKSAVQMLNVKENGGKPLSVLIFCPTTHMCDQLAKEGIPGCNSVVLYGGLSEEEQALVDQPSPLRKIIFSTNIAESSLTIPNLGAVVDSGLENTKHETLETSTMVIGVCSQASSTQRKGRVGRVGDGLYFLIMTQEMSEKRPLSIRSQFYSQPKHRAVLQLLQKGFDAGKVLQIPQEEYTTLLQELDKFGCVETTSKGIEVTNVGRRINGFILSIKASLAILRAMDVFRVTESDYHNQTDAFYQLLGFVVSIVVSEATRSESNVIFVPREKRNRGDKKEYVCKMLAPFAGTDEIATLSKLFCECMANSFDRSGNLNYRNWGAKNSVNSKWIEQCVRLFRQTTATVFDFSHSLTYSKDFEELGRKVDEFSEETRQIIGPLYDSQILYFRGWPGRIRYISRTGDVYIVTNPVSNMWNSPPAAIIACSHTEIQTSSGILRLITLCFPVELKRPELVLSQDSAECGAASCGAAAAACDTVVCDTVVFCTDPTCMDGIKCAKQNAH